jgi:cholinesterase
MNNPKSTILLLSLILSASPVGASPFSSLYVLGDSLSDIGASSSAVYSIYNFLGGNCDPGHPCPPYFDGRYSNGPIAAELLADSILPGGADSTNYFSFAVAGSTTGIGNFGDGGSTSRLGFGPLPGMAFQITTYLPNVNTHSEALHLVWGGANDFLTGDSASGAAQNIAGTVSTLAAAGAKNILVPNLPNLSVTPFVQSQTSAEIESAYHFSVDFNTALSGHLEQLGALYPTTTIFQFDTFSLFENILENPTSYGFSNTADACVVLPDVCADATGYLFWDDFHPTHQVHQIFASAMASAVPLPGSLFLFMTALAGLAWTPIKKAKSVGFRPGFPWRS